jgi:hypothetical protein
MFCPFLTGVTPAEVPLTGEDLPGTVTIFDRFANNLGVLITRLTGERDLEDNDGEQQRAEVLLGADEGPEASGRRAYPLTKSGS